METYKTKYGYVAYDYETYQMLKEINHLYMRYLMWEAMWDRWYYKKPQNQVAYKILRDPNGRKIGREKIGKLYVIAPHRIHFGPANKIYRLALSYERARRPSPNPVKQIMTPEEIRKFYSEIVSSNYRLNDKSEWYRIC